jgi:hypothetical protein
VVEQELQIVLELQTQVEMVDLVVVEVQEQIHLQLLQQDLETLLQYLLLKVKMVEQDFILLVITKLAVVAVELELLELVHLKALQV